MADVITPTAAEGDIIVEQGATFDLLLTWMDKSGDLIDLTDYTARLQVRDFPGAGQVLLEMTTENGMIQLGGSAGTIRLFMDMDETAALSFDSGKYQLELYPPTTGTERLLKGRYIIDKEIVVD